MISSLKLLGMSEDQYKDYVQSYVDRVDAQCRKNEFSEAGKVVRELIADVVSRRQVMYAELRVDAEKAVMDMQHVVNGLRVALDPILEDSHE